VCIGLGYQQRLPLCTHYIWSYFLVSVLDEQGGSPRHENTREAGQPRKPNIQWNQQGTGELAEYRCNGANGVNGKEEAGPRVSGRDIRGDDVHHGRDNAEAPANNLKTHGDEY